MWGGFAGNRFTANSSAYEFAGPQTTVTTVAGQRLVGAAQAPLALASGVQSIRYDLCYQNTVPGSTVNNFTGGNYSVGEVSATRVSFSAAASVVPGAGTWLVGFCVLNTGSATTFDNDYVNGWVLVVNP